MNNIIDIKINYASKSTVHVFCIQVENVGSLTMSRVSAAASVKLTAKHLKSVVIEDSTFQVVCKNVQNIM